MRILLTGATGFLGSHLLEKLLENHHQVVILKRTSSDTWRIKHLLDQIKAYDVDVEPIESAFQSQKIDAVIHTACHYGRNQDAISQGKLLTPRSDGVRLLIGSAYNGSYRQTFWRALRHSEPSGERF